MQMAMFHSFFMAELTLDYIYIHTHPSSSIPVDGHLGYFHVLAVVNSAACELWGTCIILS